MATQMDARQSVLRSALNMAGSAVNAGLDSILIATDPLIGKLFEDRNILLTDGGSITFTGTQLQFSENLNLVLNQKISGAVPQIISLGLTTQNFTTSGDMWVAVVNRTAGTATTSIITAGNPLPAVTNANQEVFLIAKRIDAGDGTQRLYFRNGMALNAGQTVRLGAAGSGSGGSGTGSDLGSLQFRAQFLETFTEAATNAASAVNGTTGFTNATYSAAKSMYTISYDASRTMNTTGTAATLSATPSFTVAAGDVVVNLATNEVKKITAISSQTAYTLESAFSTNLAAQSVCVSQAVHTKDIYNYSGTGAAISAAFSSSAFSEIMVDYEDNATSGSNLWTPNVAPFVGFTASTDNTNYTTLKTRATLETDTMQSVICSTSSAGLFIRFFSDKTSGTGFVNLIQYEAFMQKSTTSSQGSSLWSAYGMTNNSTTSKNMTVSLAGGKTTIAFTGGNVYAIGVNPGNAFGVLDVYLNGQLVPRFVSGTTPTTDASYTEVSPTIIQLDRDYSSQALDIQVVSRVQVSDASSQNSTTITAILNAQSAGFQGFVDTSTVRTATITTGVPAAGTFLSNIVNRAAIPDISQDLRVSMGIERIATQQLTLMQNEFGTNGEQVAGVLNDDRGLIRFVGTWSAIQSSAGEYINTNTVNDFIEITFYGTALNLLTQTHAAFDVRATVDGGTEGGNLITAGSAVLVNRNYSPNQIVTVISGLALGVHTIKLRNNAALGPNIAGFEVINGNSATSLNVNSGVAYIAGSKLTALTATALTYNTSFDSGTLGTRGGHVVVYQKADGTIGKAVTPANAGQANLTAADHTNEEVVRTYFWREFAAGRTSTDDFSTVNITTSTSARAFTLDDGTTSLVASDPYNVKNDTNGNVIDAMGNINGGTTTFTFVGTGLDLVRSTGNTTSNTKVETVSVDGTSIGSLPAITVANQVVVTKIVSGLPYGTHTVSIIRTSGTASEGFSKFIVYQPKKPSVPTGAVELADYNIMATYAVGTAGLTKVATGVLRKTNTRESSYVDGTGGANNWTYDIPPNAADAIAGINTLSDRLNASQDVVFFGTGFELRQSVNTDRSSSIQLSLNGSNLTTANFVTMSSATYGGSAFNATTGIASWNGSVNIGAGIAITGLPLGVYRLRQNNGLSGTNVNRIFGLVVDVITPIHSVKTNLADLQSTLPVGSSAISDNRKFTPVKDAIPATKAWAQAIAITSNPTTTSQVQIPMPDMNVSIKTNGGALDISYTNMYQISVASNNGYAQIYVNGVAQGTEKSATESGTGFTAVQTDRLFVPVPAGTHRVEIYWRTSTGTMTAFQLERTLAVREN